MRIHSRKMNVNSEVNFDELARCTDDFNGAQLKAVCVEAGMIALRRGASELIHEDYMDGEWVWLIALPWVTYCHAHCRHYGSPGQEES